MSIRLALGSMLAAVLATQVAQAEIPLKTRADIINYGRTGIGSPYVWGGGNWDPHDRSYGGADCSGFVAKCWSLARWTPYRVNYHSPYSTYSLIQTPGPYWDEVDRADLLYGDAIVYRYGDDSGGHTYLYLSSDGWGAHEVYEARGSAYGIVHRWRTVISDPSAVKGIRRTRLLENVDVTEYIIETDDGAPFYTDSGMTGSSQWDSYAPGCREGDCRYRWVTATRSETCTFRPDLPEAGWYRLYVTCNQDSPNVHDVGVNINHAMGSERLLWDQADSANLNRWVALGGQSYYFEAGTDGTVVWDDFDAWPTSGDHVFRGDATRFSLDNRVVVDGIGATAGRFATLRDALAWLKTRESEEPNVIDLTVNTLVEDACIEVDLWDDVTINGDADGDGVPVTIAVSPSVPADWSRSCAMYLNVPIQHHYELRDVVIIPQYLAAGHATEAYGLVIDEHNPSGEACALSVTLENVTVAGSLPGNIATDPTESSRDLATMFGGTDAGFGAAVLQRDADWAGDDGCRQTIVARDLTITHSATRGLALRSAYTDWDIDGGLTVSHCGMAGVRADYIGAGSLRVRDSSGVAPNVIHQNLGGGVVNEGDAGAGFVSLANCYVSDNVSAFGGGVTSNDATTEIRNCLLVGNTTTSCGGAFDCIGGNVTIVGCTIVANSSPGSGGAVCSWGSTVEIANSIIWEHGSDPIAGNATVRYCVVQGGHAGIGVSHSDPAFVHPAGGDYHLRRHSPGVNSGDPLSEILPGETDLDGSARRRCGFVDVGAYETPYWDGDVDHDEDVDAEDLATLLGCLSGPDAPPSDAGPVPVAQCLDALDFDEDGDIDLHDLAGFRLRE